MRTVLPPLILIFVLSAPAWADQAQTTGQACQTDNQILPGQSDLQAINGALSQQDGKLDLNGCGAMIKSADELEFLHEVDGLNDSFWQGKVTAQQWQAERAAIRKKFNPKQDDNLNKLLAIGMTASDKSAFQYHIALAALDAANGVKLSDANRQKLAQASGLKPEDIDSAVAHEARSLSGYAKSLKDVGITYSARTHGWDISNAHFNVSQLSQASGNATLKSGLGLFLSAAAMKALSDPRRREPIPFAGPGGKKLVILPPARSPDGSTPKGEIRVISQDDYNKDLNQVTDDYKDARSKFLVSSKASSSMWNFVKNQGAGLNLCWGEHCLWSNKPNEKATAADVEKNKDYTRLLHDQYAMLDFGAPQKQVSQMQQDMLNVMKQDTKNLDGAIAKINSSIKAATLAQEALATYATLGAASEIAAGSETLNALKYGPNIIRAARAGLAGFKAMSQFPILLSGATMVVDSGIDTYKYGGGFMCHFAENLADQGPAAVSSAIKWGLIGTTGAAGEAVSIVAAAHGVEAAKAAEAGLKVSSSIQKFTGIAFNAQMAIGGAQALVRCGQAYSQNAANTNSVTQVASSANMLKTCAQAPIDLSFAVKGGMDLAATAGDVVAGVKSGNGFVDSVSQGAKAAFVGPPGEANPELIDTQNPANVRASIEKIASQPGATEQDLAPVAKRLAGEANTKDLVNYLQDPNAAISLTAQKALSTRTDPDSAQKLIQIAEKSPTSITKISRFPSDKETVAQKATTALQARNILLDRASNGDPVAQEYVLKMASSSNPTIRQAAIDKGTSLQNSARFQKILNDGLKDKTIRSAAAEILATQNTPTANQAIADLLTHSNPDVDKAVIRELEKRNDEQASQLLKIARTDSKDPALRKEADIAIAAREKRMPAATNDLAPAGAIAALSGRGKTPVQWSSGVASYLGTVARNPASSNAASEVATEVLAKRASGNPVTETPGDPNAQQQVLRVLSEGRPQSQAVALQGIRGLANDSGFQNVVDQALQDPNSRAGALKAMASFNTDHFNSKLADIAADPAKYDVEPSDLKNAIRPLVIRGDLAASKLLDTIEQTTAGLKPQIEQAEDSGAAHEARLNGVEDRYKSEFVKLQGEPGVNKEGIREVASAVDEAEQKKIQGESPEEVQKEVGNALEKADEDCGGHAENETPLEKLGAMFSSADNPFGDSCKFN